MPGLSMTGSFVSIKKPKTVFVGVENPVGFFDTTCRVKYDTEH